MAIKNLFENRTDSLGETNELVCPLCHQSTCMPLFKNYDLVNVIAIIKGADTQLSIAVCPKCSSVFTVNRDYIDALSAGQTVYATPNDLTVCIDGTKDKA